MCILQAYIHKRDEPFTLSVWSKILQLFFFYILFCGWGVGFFDKLLANDPNLLFILNPAK